MHEKHLNIACNLFSGGFFFSNFLLLEKASHVSPGCKVEIFFLEPCGTNPGSLVNTWMAFLGTPSESCQLQPGKTFGGALASFRPKRTVDVGLGEPHISQMLAAQWIWSSTTKRQ